MREKITQSNLRSFTIINGIIRPHSIRKRAAIREVEAVKERRIQRWHVEDHALLVGVFLRRQQDTETREVRFHEEVRGIGQRTESSLLHHASLRDHAYLLER